MASNDSVYSARYIERQGRTVRENGGGSTTYLVGRHLYETDFDGDGTRIAIYVGPASIADFEAARGLR